MKGNKTSLLVDKQSYTHAPTHRHTHIYIYIYTRIMKCKFNYIYIYMNNARNIIAVRPTATQTCRLGSKYAPAVLPHYCKIQYWNIHSEIEYSQLFEYCKFTSITVLKSSLSSSALTSSNGGTSESRVSFSLITCQPNCV